MITKKQFLGSNRLLKSDVIINFLKKNKENAYKSSEIQVALKKEGKKYTNDCMHHCLQYLKKKKKVLHKMPYYIYK